MPVGGGVAIRATAYTDKEKPRIGGVSLASMPLLAGNVTWFTKSARERSWKAVFAIVTSVVRSLPHNTPH